MNMRIHAGFLSLMILSASAGCANLIEETKKQNVSVVQSLLEGGADVNAKDEDGRVALYYAAERGNVNIVRELLDHGANVNVKDPQDVTPLIIAARNSHSAVTRELIDRGADIHARCFGRSALGWAAEGGDLEVVIALLKKGADVHEKNENGTTVLMWAAKGGHTNIVKYLLEKGADPRAADKDGRTALSYAHQYRRRLMTGMVSERLSFFASVTLIKIYDPKTKRLIATESTNSPRGILIRAINSDMLIESDSPHIRRLLDDAADFADKKSAKLISILDVF